MPNGSLSAPGFVDPTTEMPVAF
uniref:Uncharacterized protein n=1 Tax=Arundo donax TaxID=35708 RepID=A0A0A9C303_ARUDO